MNRTLSLPGLVLGALIVDLGAAQVTVLSTRSFSGEVVDLAAAPGGFETGTVLLQSLGLEDLVHSHGTPVHVDILLDIEWDFDFSITNQSMASTQFVYAAPLEMMPRYGDCTPYSGDSLWESTGQVVPGGVGSLQVSEVLSYGFSGATWNTGCPGPWIWNGLDVQSDPFQAPLTIDQNVGVPVSWVQVNHARATLNGEMQVTWAPHPVLAPVICGGSAVPGVALEAYGDIPNVYLAQVGAPISTNLLVQADQATPTVMPSGLCVAGTIRRVPGSLSQGGATFRFPEPGVLVGTTTYFQAWFRNGPGTSATSECIALTF